MWEMTEDDFDKKIEDGEVPPIEPTTPEQTTLQPTTPQPTTPEQTTPEATTPQPTTPAITTPESTTEVAKLPAPEGLGWAGDDNYPYYFLWKYVEGAMYYNFYVDGVHIGNTLTTEYNADAQLFQKDGEYVIGVAAVDEKGNEGEMATITHTIEKQETSSESSTVEQSTPEMSTPESSSPEGTTPESSKLEVTTPNGVNVTEQTTKGQSGLETTTVKSVNPSNAIKVKVGKTKVKKALKKKGSKKVKISLKKIKGATGYQVRIYKSKKAKKALVRKTVKKVKFNLIKKKVKNKKKLYIRARAYRIVKGRKYYGKWSKRKKIKISK